MRQERAAQDDGVSYQDGDVVYGGSRADEISPANNEIMTLWSPALCDVELTENKLSPAKLTDPGRIKDCDDAETIGRVISDVDEYIGTEYPSYMS
jgi:hypothetical protein